MIYPSIEDLSKKDENRYSLVIAVAKRAREISDMADRAGIPMEENPVSTAINDIFIDKIRIVEPDLSLED